MDGDHRPNTLFTNTDWQFATKSMVELHTITQEVVDNTIGTPEERWLTDDG